MGIRLATDTPPEEFSRAGLMNLIHSEINGELKRFPLAPGLGDAFWGLPVSAAASVRHWPTAVLFTLEQWVQMGKDQLDPATGQDVPPPGQPVPFKLLGMSVESTMATRFMLIW